MTAPGSTTNRDAILVRCPPWLQGDTSGKVMYTLGLMLDTELEQAIEGSLAHMPGLGTYDALQYIGDDDVIARGFLEASPAYAVRLQQAYDTWATAGSAWSVLRNLLGFVSPFAPVVRTVMSTGNWDSMNDPLARLDGCPTWRVQNAPGPSNWNWDNGLGYPTTYAGWWRGFTIMYPPAGLWVPAPLIGNGPPIGTTTGSIGCSASVAQGQSMRNIAGTFKAANVWIQWMILSFDSTLFPPMATLPSSKLPDGNWGRWAKVASHQYVPSRNTSACYADGVQP